MANIPTTYDKAKRETVASYGSYQRMASTARLYHSSIFQDGDIVYLKSRSIRNTIKWTEPNEVRFFNDLIKAERDWYMGIRPLQIEFRDNAIAVWREHLYRWMHDVSCQISKSKPEDVLDFIEIASGIDVVMNEFPDEVPDAMTDWWLSYEILK